MGFEDTREIVDRTSVDLVAVASVSSAVVVAPSAVITVPLAVVVVPRFPKTVSASAVEGSGKDSVFSPTDRLLLVVVLLVLTGCSCPPGDSAILLNGIASGLTVQSGPRS